jgi:hypothetical protein
LDLNDRGIGLAFNDMRLVRNVVAQFIGLVNNEQMTKLKCQIKLKIQRTKIGFE